MVSKVIQIKNHNNDEGSLVVGIEFSIGAESFIQEYLVSGFKTTYLQHKDDVNAFIPNLNLVPTQLGQKLYITI